jgi:hypothetical protein
MKVSRSFIAITVAFSLAMLPSAIAVDKTSARSAGPTPTTVVNTILSGAGIPSKTLGINGDFYIDTKNLNLYGPKSKGGWKVSTSLRANEVPVIANVIGEPGAMGQTGAKGATGATGALGETGLQGLQGPQGLQGVQGVQGTKGDNGINGSTGATGTQGVQGTKGDNGTNGAQGIQGLQGLTGAAGTNGLTGAQGLPGLQGATGVTGNVGATGATGGQGVKGDTGLTGATGGQGSQGATGGQGAKGDTGLTGAQGLPGLQGSTGVTGNVGATGATGGQGSQGAKGDTGLNGSTGGQGSQGATGGQGAKGDTGLTGSTGSQGEAGISVSKFVILPLTTFGTGSAGNSATNAFFTTSSSGSYTFEILLSGIIGVSNPMKLYAEIVTGNETIGSQFAVASDAITAVNGVSGRQYGFRIIGAVANVNSGITYSIRIGINDASASIDITFMGRALVNKVGSIG